MSAAQPLVSIIMLSYNHERYIGAAIRSVLAQTYCAWELIISDDGSADDSHAVIGAFDDQRITVIIAEQNEGAAAAYNKALARCRGTYITSVDSDDFIAPEKLGKQVAYLEAHPDVGILGTYVVEVDAEGHPSGDTDGHEQWFNHTLDLNNPENWIWQNRLCHSSVMLRRTTHDQIGLPNNDLVYTPDNDLWLRALVAGARFYMLPEQLTCYRSHGENVTHKNPTKFYWEYLYLFCLYLKPYLVQHKNERVLQDALRLFLAHDVWTHADATHKAHIVNALFMTDDMVPLFAAFFEQLALPVTPAMATLTAFVTKQQAEAEAQRQWIAELTQARAWFEEQLKSWQTEAEHQTATIQTQQTYINELERGKAWLEEQRAQLQAMLEQQRTQVQATLDQQQRTTLEQQQAWITELEQGKAWLDEQRTTWQAEAERRAITIDDQQQWISQLEEAKTWHEQQASHWQAQASHWQAQASHWQAQVERVPKIVRKLTDTTR